jgi:hypothetical protein
MEWQRAAAHFFLGSVCPICGGKEGCNSGQPAIAEQEAKGRWWLLLLQLLAVWCEYTDEADLN